MLFGHVTPQISVRHSHGDTKTVSGTHSGTHDVQV